ncbi:solute carrier family 35 related protein [Nitzschia inconspicua]|uniref:Solute carrier family 35 related protein n=1 Tax=Nitzschia inconspicua TaxID=303405 RepID=A0A9K3PTA0_9STRA|nr:solute carrier family 35 related protein [Nitzschia inconspicua]
MVTTETRHSHNNGVPNDNKNNCDDVPNTTTNEYSIGVGSSSPNNSGVHQVFADVGRTTTTSSASSTRRHCLHQALYHLKGNWKILLLGQGLSLLLASGGAAQATLHLECDLSAPTFTMALIYGGLSMNILVLVWRRLQSRWSDGFGILRQQSAMLTSDLTLNAATATAQEDDEGREMEGYRSTTPLGHGDSSSCFGLLPPFHRPLWWYFIIAFLDVQANAVTILAFRYTTLTSVTLFDALAIPSSMFISKCWLQRHYRCMHFVGVVACMLGVVANVSTDYQSDVESHDLDAETETKYPHRLRGDLAAIVGGLLYGLNDVLTEVTVRDAGDNTEYLAIMGSFAVVISLIQSLLFEWDEILKFFGRNDSQVSTCSLQKGWWLCFTFVGVTMLSYTGASRFLIVSEAAFFNLSLLTGDLWSIIFSVAVQQIIPRPLFFVALVFVLSGVILYEMAPSPAIKKAPSPPNEHDVNDGIIMVRRSSSLSLINSDDIIDEDGIELH